MFFQDFTFKVCLGYKFSLFMNPERKGIKTIEFTSKYIFHGKK